MDRKKRKTKNRCAFFVARSKPIAHRRGMNGRILAIGLAGILGFTSCTQIKGDRNLGQFSYTSLGGNAEGMDLSPEGVKVANINNSLSFKEATDAVAAMFKAYLTAAGLKYSVGKYYDNEGAALKSSETVKLEELRNAKSVTEGEQALDALRITHVPVAP